MKAPYVFLAGTDTSTLHKQYLVKWKEYPEWENTWEWWDTLSKAKKLIEEYEKNI